MLKKYTFNIDPKSDEKMFNALENTSNKTEFIKNALFYYIVALEKGDAVDRYYHSQSDIIENTSAVEEHSFLSSEVNDIVESEDEDEEDNSDFFSQFV